ncbi:MAG: LytTR family transcriptional regulator DNA-binding domain-containing protein [Clostridiales bacterium]|nr:LytTR family transcriptional regulator DNA-binding domain-containing protein [Clostridiales bacterium]MCF8023659.1 LytTR family transcriptional regulator DNA-binding domain-containing protein [Clostridiales bacterium]
MVTTNDSYKIRANIEEFEQIFQYSPFVRCHKSFIVNLQQVYKISEYGNNSYSVSFKNKRKTIPATAKRIKKFKIEFNYFQNI